MKKPLYSALSLALLAAVYVSQGAAMSIFFGGEKTEVVLFSPLEGKLTYNGKPAAGAKINLRIAWKDQEGETYLYKSDSHGLFQIPEHSTTYKPHPLAQLVISQEILVEYAGNVYEAWIMSKMEPGAFTELGGRPVGLVCELSNELVTVRGHRSLGGTVCTWDRLEEK